MLAKVLPRQPMRELVSSIFSLFSAGNQEEGIERVAAFLPLLYTGPDYAHSKCTRQELLLGSEYGQNSAKDQNSSIGYVNAQGYVIFAALNYA